MSRTTKIALAVALILNTAVAASAAAKKGTNHPEAARAPTATDPLNSARDSPATTGGGSIGYNQNLYIS